MLPKLLKDCIIGGSIGILLALGTIFLVSILASCSSMNPIPIAYECPTLDLPPDPIPATKSLTGKSRPDEIMKAWVKTATDYYQWNQIVHAEVETSR